jgi:sulfate transport system ATP-binding protein
MSIVISGLVKSFGNYAALRGVDLAVRPGEFLALLGPSGSGKTTLLRILSGLDAPDAGSLTVDGEDIGGQRARDRQMGFVFQHYALFRHMTVVENVAFGLRVKPRAQRLSRPAIAERVDRLLRLMQLERMGGRYPAQLSGGQRARSPSSPRCCCSTSRSARSTPRSARSYAAGSATCTTRWGSPASS